MYDISRLQHHLRDIRESCSLNVERDRTSWQQQVEDIRGMCRQLYKHARKAGVHQASIDVKAAAGRAFDWQDGLEAILQTGAKSFGKIVKKTVNREPLPNSLCFDDLWRYQV